MHVMVWSENDVMLEYFEVVFLFKALTSWPRYTLFIVWLVRYVTHSPLTSVHTH